MSQGPETVLSGPLGPLLAVRAPHLPPFSNDQKELAPLPHPPGERAAQHNSSANPTVTPHRSSPMGVQSNRARGGDPTESGDTTNLAGFLRNHGGGGAVLLKTFNRSKFMCRRPPPSGRPRERCGP